MALGKILQKCSRCQLEKTEKEFAPSVWKSGYGYCRPCSASHKHENRRKNVRSTPEYLEWKTKEYLELSSLRSLDKYRRWIARAINIASMTCSRCEMPLKSPAAGLLFKDGEDVTFLVSRLAAKPSIDLARKCSTVCRNCAKIEEWEKATAQYKLTDAQFKEKMRKNKHWTSFMEEQMSESTDG